MTSLFCKQCNRILHEHSEKELIECTIQLCEVVKT
mgnify:CR=1 FL=1|jgi:hypothetical protein